MTWKDNLRYKWHIWKKIPYNTYLCLRFNFLYPRNRFSGKHHAYILQNLRSKLYYSSTQEICVTGKLIKEPKEFPDYLEYENFSVKLDKKNNKLTIYHDTESFDIDLTSLLWKGKKFNILGLTSYVGSTFHPNVIVNVETIDKNDTSNYGFHYETHIFAKSKFKQKLLKIVEWIDEKILDNIFILPTFTELDSMKPGWRKAFGIQMCKEIKQALLKYGREYYKNYRIMQWKEKWGQNVVYDMNSVKEVHDIISKYETISYNTCICCGKPATKISSGWISPYCDDCYPTYKDGSRPIVQSTKVGNNWKETDEYIQACEEIDKMYAKDKKEV